MKNKFFVIGLLSIALVFGMLLAGCNSGEETWTDEPESPKLTSLTIGTRRATLGTPDADPSKATEGRITLTGDEGSSTIQNPAISPAGHGKAQVKYAVTVNKDVIPGAYGNAPTALSNAQNLWVELTNESLSAYYTIRIIINSDQIESDPASREWTLAAWNAASAADKALTVVMAGTAAYTYQWYSNTTLSNSGGTVITGATNASYTPNLTATGNTYYYVTVTLPTNEVLTSNPACLSIVDAITEAPTEFQIGTDRLNYIRGVGGSGSFMFRTGGNADASPDADVNYIDLFCGVLGANVLRIMVQDDYLNYIQNKVQSRNSAQFYHNARDNFFPVIRKVNEYGGYVFANPWTGRPNVKDSNRIDGGNLIETGPNYVTYANHLRDFLKWLELNDAPIFSLGILNEPDYGAGSAYEGMGMTPEVSRDWFKTVGHFTTQKVTNPTGAGTTTSIFATDIISGYGGGGPTHHVLIQSGDPAGHVKRYYDAQLDDPVSNNNIEIISRHYYGNASRYERVAGINNTVAWANRPQVSYTGKYETESLAMSPQMYAPGSRPGSIKREIWQTEHDFNFNGNSTQAPANNVQQYWNSAFATLNDIDWCFRLAGESVYDWWYSSSWSGLVTSYQLAGWPIYTITPRGRAFAHYGRYVNETWLLPISRTKGTIDFNVITVTDGPDVSNNDSNYNAGSTDPKISAFEDTNGKFISVVMYTPSNSTAGANGGRIAPDFGTGGTYGNNDPTAGSINVGRVKINLPNGFIASSASAIRSYGSGKADSGDAAWAAANPVAAGKPRYWIDEPVFVSADGKSVEVTLPAGNVISIMIKGGWTGTQLTSRYFEERVRPFNAENAAAILNRPQNAHNKD